MEQSVNVLQDVGQSIGRQAGKAPLRTCGHFTSPILAFKFDPVDGVPSGRSSALDPSTWASGPMTRQLACKGPRGGLQAGQTDTRPSLRAL
eukprot:1183723-Prorocentrum_minimum.AAC.2